MNISGQVGGIVAIALGAVVFFVLLGLFIAESNTVFQITNNSTRFPVFGSSLGGLAPLVLGFLPMVLIGGGLAFLYLRGRRQ